MGVPDRDKDLDLIRAALTASGRDDGGLSTAEIAAALGISTKSACALVARLMSEGKATHGRRTTGRGIDGRKLSTPVYRFSE